MIDAEAERNTRGRPPTFTSWLRNLTDTELAALFAARPDLISPVPADIAALAARAAAKPAVLRVLDRLDRFSLQILEGLVALGDDRLAGPPGVEPGALAAALGLPVDRLDPALATLCRTALVWEDGKHLRPVAVLRDIIPHPAGLGPPLRVLLGALPADRLNRLATDLGLVAGYAEGSPAERIAAALSRPERIDALLDSAGADAGPVIHRLVWGPPHGTVSEAARDIDTASAASPIERLLARGLLVPIDGSTVALPLEVGLHLRGGLLFQHVAATAPELSGTERTPTAITRASAGQAFTAIRSVEELLEHWADDPPSVLRNGGLGTRDLRRAARELDTDEAGTALFIETAHAAGLIAADGDVDGEWLPTPDYDLWRETTPERRWLRLAEAWLRSTRVAALNGSKDARGRSRAVLSDGLDRRSAPEVRLDVLRALAAAPEGLAPAPESIADHLAWQRPRRQGPTYSELVDAALREAAALGLTGRGALAPHARALLDELDEQDAPVADREEARSAAVLAGELPQPADRILVQADLTAIAPGPLVPELARELALAADVESTGGATVYRFTSASIRRALDAGRGAADLTALLERHSSTPLPQPLRYLISDVGRRHGRLRVGTASSYLRCEEPALLDELVSDRRAADLALFRLAPTVVASRSTRPVLLERLTDLGYHPVAEAADGAVQISRPDPRRAEGRSVSRHIGEPAPPGPKLRAAAIRAIRAGDAAATAVRRPIPAPDAEPPRSPTAATLSALTAAVARGRSVWIGYLDTDGRASSRIVEPASVDGGYLTAYDATRAAVHRFAVHRITGVADLDSGQEPTTTAEQTAGDPPGAAGF
ncbi:MAG: helicase-associated domain-containing protein [Nocardiopsaceae bacterium]|nr:helicase-associated domain-containing protein [Nocardiopsaceae bacterium]